MIHARSDYSRFQDPALKKPELLGEGSTPIADDEPVFLLRAQDKHAAAAVRYYAMLLVEDPDVDPEMAVVCLRWSNRMRGWFPQKSPDMPGH